MSDEKTCMICHRVFDPEIEGFMKEVVEGVWLYVCSEICVIADTLSREVVCIVHSHCEEPNEALFGIHNLN